MVFFLPSARRTMLCLGAFGGAPGMWDKVKRGARAGRDGERLACDYL